QHAIAEQIDALDRRLVPRPGLLALLARGEELVQRGGVRLGGGHDRVGVDAVAAEDARAIGDRLALAVALAVGRARAILLDPHGPLGHRVDPLGDRTYRELDQLARLADDAVDRLAGRVDRATSLRRLGLRHTAGATHPHRRGGDHIRPAEDLSVLQLV